MNLRNWIGNLCIGLGIIIMGAALFLTIQNMLIEQTANQYSQDLVSQLGVQIQSQSESWSQGNYGTLGESDILELAAMEESERALDPRSYLGILEIPTLGLQLPVRTSWSYAALAYTPCVYQGSLSQDNLIIAGHNYKAHFATLTKVNLGDTMSFVTMAGETHDYMVSGIEMLDETQLEELTSGTWDLTLFTCDAVDREERLVIRLVRQNW